MLYQDVIRQREIHRLCHFTRIDRLQSILENGLLASNYEGIEKNDADRWDGHLDCICTSVEYPNTFYLAQLVERTNTNIEDWVILEINTGVINDSSLFCQVNAAKDSGMHLKSGVEAFSSLFDSHIEISSRDRNKNWIDCVPTDLQAEILIRDRIDVGNLTGVIFHSNCNKNLIPHNIPNHIRLRHSKDLFAKYGVVNWLDQGKFPYDFALK